MTSKSKVYFFFDGVHITLSNRKKMKETIAFIFKNERKALATLNYIFCTDKKLLSINRKYLNHDFYTDIITFDLSGENESIIGEVYISIDRVLENANSLNISTIKELTRVIFHGALHLCGYKDKTKGQITIMRRKEEQYMKTFWS